jgi:A/G-specific adenine glycosylase
LANLYSAAGVTFKNMIAEELLQWYQLNKRDLPWRDCNDPYKIWLSEIILQQTRVQQGMPWYLSFISAFPTIHDLAQSSEEKVLKLWQGLGYYSRARNLHATAKIIARNLKGQFPDEPEELLKLKGVGPYTAAAIASFAFGKPVIALDGNLLRVGSRIFGIESPIDENVTRKQIESEFLRVMPRKKSGEFNQSLMDLGAEICTPTTPACSDCPVAIYCSARRENKVEQLPKKKSKTAVKQVHIYYFVLRSNKGILLRHRTQDGIWKNMYDFPAVESDEPLTPMPFPPLSGFQAPESPPEYLGTITHALSHRKINASFYLWKSSGFKPEESFFWKSRSRCNDLPLPRLIEKALHQFSTRIWHQ